MHSLGRRRAAAERDDACLDRGIRCGQPGCWQAMESCGHWLMLARCRDGYERFDGVNCPVVGGQRTWMTALGSHAAPIREAPPAGSVIGRGRATRSWAATRARMVPSGRGRPRGQGRARDHRAGQRDHRRALLNGHAAAGRRPSRRGAGAFHAASGADPACLSAWAPSAGRAGRPCARNTARSTARGAHPPGSWRRAVLIQDVELNRLQASWVSTATIALVDPIESTSQPISRAEGQSSGATTTAARPGRAGQTFTIALPERTRLRPRLSSGSCRERWPRHRSPNAASTRGGDIGSR